VTLSDDLPARIARLERLLDGLENARRSVAGSRNAASATAEPSPLSRLQDIVAVLQERATRAECDDVDAIAMRVLLEEFTSFAASLRSTASGLGDQLTALTSAVAKGHRCLEELEDLRQ
jgi:hypothetical protein